MKKLTFAIAILAALTSCTESKEAQNNPSVAYDLTQNGDTSTITVLDDDSQKVMFVFSSSSVSGSGISYDKLAEACQSSTREAKSWPRFPKTFEYNGLSRIIVEKGEIQIIVEGMLKEEPTKFIMKAKTDGTVERERVI